jgi:hypothetical protein
MKRAPVVALALCSLVVMACRQTPQPERRPLLWSGWIEETAAQRGHIKPGDIAQFGCPPGWLGVEDTAAALRGKAVSTVYLGVDPLPREGTITCVAQTEFELPQHSRTNASERPPMRRPLAPVWVEMRADSTTVGFRSELPPSAPIYFAQETPCGPRVIGVRLEDLLKWLADPQTAPKRDFLGMVSAGCPDGQRPQ